MTVLSALLRQLRTDAKLTLQDASAKAEISLAHLSDIERGRSLPSVPALERLLGVYGCRLAIVNVEAVDKVRPGHPPRLLDEV